LAACLAVPNQIPPLGRAHRGDFVGGGISLAADRPRRFRTAGKVRRLSLDPPISTLEIAAAAG
jgi:hypothetical protein